MPLQKYAPQWKKEVVFPVSESSGLSCNFGTRVNRSWMYIKKVVGSGETVLTFYKTVHRRDIEVLTVRTSDRTPVKTGIGWAEISRKRQNLNRSNGAVCLQPKSANLRTSKTVTTCLRCDESKLRMEKWHLRHKCEFNRPKCYADTKTLNP